ncbi:hypothetical protein BN1013_00693 [Candidatus Rubidus massiliensis]|nr:hypothetical protein BN1013_00693 [Candidatus Rubidus massiliensis]
MKLMNGVLNFKMLSSVVNQRDNKQKNRNVLLLGLMTASILAAGLFTAASSMTFTKTKGCQCTSTHCLCGTNCPCGNQCNCR